MEIEARGLPTSWAIPAAMVPRVTIFAAWSISASKIFFSVCKIYVSIFCLIISKEGSSKEKSSLKEKLESGGIKLEPEEITELKIENEALKTELSQLQETLQAKHKATPQTLALVEAERLIEDFQEQVPKVFSPHHSKSKNRW